METAAKPIRIGVVGCGRIAQIMHLPFLSELREIFELAALCDISPGALAHCGTRFAVPEQHRFSTTEAMLKSTELDAVLVCDELHTEACIAASRAGCHVLVEKPMAYSLEACDAMIEAASEAKRILMMAYMRCYDPAYEYARARVAKLREVIHVSAHDFVGPENAFIGDIHEVRRFSDAAPNQAAYERRFEEALGPFANDAKGVYGWLLGLSTHDLSILRGMFGAPSRIVAAMQARQGHVFHALLEYRDGITGILEYGFLPNLKTFDQVLSVYAASEVVKVRFASPFVPFAPTRVEICEAEGPGRRERPDRPDLPAGHAGRGTRESVVVPSYDEAFRRELHHFAHCIRSGTPPQTSALDGRDDVRICIELAKAAFQGLRVI